MKSKSILNFICLCLLLDLCFSIPSSGQSALSINDQGYFEMPGLDVIVFNDYYPGGHQSGITIIQNGERVAANGDIRLGGAADVGNKNVDKAAGTIETRLNYPRIPLQYSLQVKAVGRKILITADLDQPLPEEWVGKAWFQIELFPAILFGKSWNMDGKTGIFPTDSYSPMTGTGVEPYAEGRLLSVAPDVEKQRLYIRALKGNLQLVDGRTDTKAGWFVVRTAVPPDQTKGAIEWEIEAVPATDYIYNPVIHISQVGYLPNQTKKAVIEFDKRTKSFGTIDVMKINADGKKSKVLSAPAVLWGKYLRYNYAICDFSKVQDPGMYMIQYGGVNSNLFTFVEDIYERHGRQTTLEYFLPLQLCQLLKQSILLPQRV